MSWDWKLDGVETTLPDADMKKKFRSCVMRATYLAQDDPSIAEAVKSLAQRMSSPSEADLSQLKRIGKVPRDVPDDGD